ncbi:MAG: hypothetical protein AVDCRST_MAG20-421, partial [uncultured Acidimicrobiales bacterium]
GADVVRAGRRGRLRHEGADPRPPRLVPAAGRHHLRLAEGGGSRRCAARGRAGGLGQGTAPRGRRRPARLRHLLRPRGPLPEGGGLGRRDRL